MSVRMALCRTAEKSNIPWREMTKEVLESDVYEVFERIQDPNLVYPDYYLNPFHAYDEGNLSWLIEEANQIVRRNWLNVIEEHHLKYSRNCQVNDILDIGCSVGVSTRYLAEKFPSAQAVPKSEVLQELSPVLFTLMKSTQPFLDEYYMLDLEETLRKVGFVNVCSILTDPNSHCNCALLIGSDLQIPNPAGTQQLTI
ncbi:unnamed protein product [Miscanthus lutarioriparius]|uniref:Uncharacterized protein n=1 Tax=Miscanthus lutarioriparius TaxID=422564 RepID=A0A811MFR8_9POAL|nr:unnamed protein product [Miscanthus lutarioriparius]